MTEPHRFLARSLIFCLVLLLILGLLYVGTRSFGPLSIYGTTIDRYRLLRELTGSRIILVGGSSMIYGMNSPVLHRLSGRHPINLAISMGLGLPFMLDEAACWARTGDVIIISPEYDHFRGVCYSSFHCLRAVAANPQCIHFCREMVSLRGFYLACISFPSLIQRYIGEDLFPEIPYRYRTNEYGDIRDEFQTGHGDSYEQMNVLTSFRRNYPDAVIIELNRFAAAREEEGIAVFFFYPPYSKSAFERSGWFIAELDSILQDQLEFPILNGPCDECYPDSLFYNTDYHLNAEGSLLRTERMWELLQPMI